MELLLLMADPDRDKVQKFLNHYFRTDLWITNISSLKSGSILIYRSEETIWLRLRSADFNQRLWQVSLTKINIIILRNV